MLKKIFFISLTLFLTMSGFCQAESVKVERLGKSAGRVKMIREGGAMYVSAPDMARALKLQLTWFGKSGQLNLKNGKGYFCVMRAGRSAVTTNGKEEGLTAETILKDGVLYAPFTFFSSGSPVAASGLKSAYAGGKFVLEKDYNLALVGTESKEGSSKIIFLGKGKVQSRVDAKGKSRVDILFPKAVVKREETLRIKDNFIDVAKISENDDGVRMVVLIKGPARFHDFYEGENNTLVFEAAEDRITRPEVLPVYDPQPGGDEPSGLKPSVLEDGGEEVVVLGDDFFGSVQTASVKPSPAVEKALPAAVIKTLPAPVVRMDTKPGKNTRKARILIDPGHGGKDPGAVRKGSAKEKDINLTVAKQLYDLLRKDKDFEVRMTRNDDTFVTLGGRAKMANNFKADMFISIHANAAKRVSANGFEVYFRSDKASSAEAAETAALENEALQYEGKSSTGVTFADLLLKSLATNENMNESSKIASHIRRAVTKNGAAIGIKVYQNNCIKQANFYVLRGVEAPSVLIEMGYMSNINDRKRLNTKVARAKIAESVRDGVVSYAKAEGWK